MQAVCSPPLAQLRRRWHLFSLLLAAVAQITFGSSGDGAGSRSNKQLLVVCNGFADARPAIVGEQPSDVPWDAQVPWHRNASASTSSPPSGHLRSAAAHLATTGKGDGPDVVSTRKPGWLRRRWKEKRNDFRNGKRFHPFGAPLSEHVIWTRPLEYGYCEEYFVDLEKRRLFFARPDEEGSCTLPLPDDLPQASAENPAWRFVAVLTRPFVHAKGCLVNLQQVPLPLLQDTAGRPLDARKLSVEASVAEPALPPGEVPTVPAEFVLVDAYTHRDLTDEEKHDGLTQFSRVDAEAFLHLEDMIEDQSITAEVVSSRTLTFDHVYQVEARRFHLVLENLQGSKTFDRLFASEGNWFASQVKSWHAITGVLFDSVDHIIGMLAFQE